MAEEGKEKKEEVSEEDLKAIQKDLEDAKKNLVSKETQEALQKAKEEARQEAQAEQKLAEMEKANKELQEKLKAKEEEAQKKLEEINKRVDSFMSSKQVVNQNPFKEDGGNNTKKGITYDEYVSMPLQNKREFEEASAMEFFGAQYDSIRGRFRKNLY